MSDIKVGDFVFRKAIGKARPPGFYGTVQGIEIDSEDGTIHAEVKVTRDLTDLKREGHTVWPPLADLVIADPASVDSTNA